MIICFYYHYYTLLWLHMSLSVIREFPLFLSLEPPKLTTPPWLLSRSNNSLTLGWRDWEFGKDIGGKSTDKIDYMV